jgi:hypothetical protein
MILDDTWDSGPTRFKASHLTDTYNPELRKNIFSCGVC